MSIEEFAKLSGLTKTQVRALMLAKKIKSKWVRGVRVITESPLPRNRPSDASRKQDNQ